MNDIKHWIELAKKIATEAHKNQTRRNGDLYITHPARIVDRVEDRLKPIAWLHDVVEDTEITIDDLISQGFPAYITDAVDLLTHKNEEPNYSYWGKILKNKDAVNVKLEDINDNLNNNPSDHARKKYAKALALFKQYGYNVDS